MIYTIRLALTLAIIWGINMLALSLLSRVNYGGVIFHAVVKTGRHATEPAPRRALRIERISRGGQLLPRREGGLRSTRCRPATFPAGTPSRQPAIRRSTVAAHSPRTTPSGDPPLLEVLDALAGALD